MRVDEALEGSIEPGVFREDVFRKLHARVIDEPLLIERLLEGARGDRVELTHVRGNDAGPEAVWIEEIDSKGMILRARESIEKKPGETLAVIRLKANGRSYFFTVPMLEDLNDGAVRVPLPLVLYEEERRDRERQSRISAANLAVDLRLSESQTVPAEVVDESIAGLSVYIDKSIHTRAGMSVAVIRPNAKRDERELFAEIRHEKFLIGRPGQKRIGLSLLPSRRGEGLIADRWNDVQEEIQRVREAASEYAIKGQLLTTLRGFSEEVVGDDSLHARPNVIEYENAEGEKIKAIVDVVGDPFGAPAVVIPPAWGKTKETVLPLASTILSTFRNAGQSVVVLRFDGVRRRGESHNDAVGNRLGYENVHYTFSQGVRDILGTIDFLHCEPQFRPRTIILVTFSVAAVEARRAISLDSRGRIGGWISVVGAPDLQSIIRAVSGGVDYLGGAERGLKFGLQSIQGLLLDIDRAAADAIENRLGFLDDARRDMAGIDIPITWVSGRYDAWMDAKRVTDILSIGNTECRRMIEVPMGHELRSSREAREIFDVVSAEVGRMALGRRLVVKRERPRVVYARQRAERARLKETTLDLVGFWRDYLIGRDADFGLDLIANTEIYREFMRRQIEALRLRDGNVVADLGAGVGVFPREVVRSEIGRRKLRIVQVDLVREALARSKVENERRKTGSIELSAVVGNLDVDSRTGSIPLRCETFDRVLASLLINYVADTGELLRAIRGLLRPNGRLVISCLREDADISMICLNGVAELRMGRGREAFGDLEGRAERSLSEFISNAAKLVDLEEQGRFRFWSRSELTRMLRGAGFGDISIVPGFGDPPQAFIATAHRSVEVGV